MAQASTSYRIESLKNDNYDTWKIQAQTILRRLGLWDYVSGKKIKPGDTADEETKNKWINDDLNAKSELILIISPNELRPIKNCSTSKDIWDTLSKIYQSKGPARKATLLKSLILQKMNERDNIRQHLNKFADTVDKLSEMDIQINNDLLSIMLLYSLPVSFENFRIAIESRDDLPTPENLKIKILEESEARTKTYPSNNHGEEAHLGRNRRYRNKGFKNFGTENRFSKNKTFRQENRTNCENCGRFNHRTIECRAKNKNENPKSFNTEEIYLATGNKKGHVNSWCLDSGCTSHLCFTKEMFREIDENSENDCLKLASEDQTTPIEGKGEVTLTFPDEDEIINLPNTLYVPNLTTNLMSVSKITDKGYTVLFKKNNAIIKDKKGQPILKAQRKDNLYYIQSEISSNDEQEISFYSPKMMLWHEKLGHINGTDLKSAMNKNIVNGLDFNTSDKLNDCEICIKGKMTRLPFPPRENQTKNILEIVHSDVWGPIKMKSHGGSQYFVTFTDEYSRYCKIYFLKRKNEVLEIFKVQKRGRK